MLLVTGLGSVQIAKCDGVSIFSYLHMHAQAAVKHEVYGEQAQSNMS